MPTPVVSLDKVNKSFGMDGVRTHVLFDIDLTLNAGEMTFIVGPSGCGKTTLISLIGGILNADTGTLRVLGHPLHAMGDNDKTHFRKQNLGFIFQQFNLIPTLTVQENVSVPLLIQGKSPTEAEEQALVYLDKVDLRERATFYPKQLSGGQQQRVSIARALIANPTIVICDEPTASLDGPTGLRIMEYLKRISTDENRCVIVVTHDNRIFHFADRMVVMEDGRIQSIEDRTTFAHRGI